MVSIRDEIAELGREQDILLAEHAEWMAHREAEREALMRRSDAEAVLYRTSENNAQAPAATTSAFSSADDLDDYTKGIAEFVYRYTAEKLAARDRKIERLEAKLDAVLTMLGKSHNLLDSKSADVVDLPKNFLRRRHG